MSNQNPQGSPWPVYGNQTGGSGDKPEAESSWPVYGQQEASQGGSGPTGQTSPYGSGSYGSNQPVYGQSGSTPYAPQASQNPYEQNQGNPYGQQPPAPSSPYGVPSGQPDPYGNPTANQSPGYYPQQAPAGGPFQQQAYGNRVPSGPLPSRTGPVLTIVAGVVMMIVIAPILFFGLIFNGIGLSQMVDDSLSVQNTGTVTVDDTGVVAVVPMSQSMTCTISNQSGSTTMTPEADGALLVARNLTPGEYQLECEGLASDADLVVMPGGSVNKVASATITALGWSTAVGFIGLGTLIGGIVWLVKRNKKRNAMMRGQW